MTSTRPALAVKNGVRPRCCDSGFPPYGPLSRRCRVPSVRAPGASSSLRAMPGARACRVRGSAHRLWSDAPLSGLVLPCFLEALAHRIAEHVETARARRRFGPDGLRASVGPTPSCSSPDRGAEMIAGGRCRGRDKPPARVPHVHPLPPVQRATHRSSGTAKLGPTPLTPAPHRGAGEPITSPGREIRSADRSTEQHTFQPVTLPNSPYDRRTARRRPRSILSSPSPFRTPLPHDV